MIQPISRRGFLSALMAATASASVLAIEDPERLLWEPGKKTIIDLGAQIAPATLQETTQITSGFQAMLLQELAQGRAPLPVRPLYMPDRYRMTLGNGTEMNFDSDWKLQRGAVGGRPMNDREKAKMAAEFDHARRQKINLRTFRLED